MFRNILLVDDDEHILKLVSFFLEQSGFGVRVCRDGLSAMEEITTNDYDLVILDISMPYMNGLKLLKQIRSQPKTSDWPVLMLTGSNNKSDIMKAKSQKVTEYVIKPPTRDDFLKRIERILGGRPQYEELKFLDDDLDATGMIGLPFRIQSLSQNGLVLIADIPMTKGQGLQVVHLGLFEKIGITKQEFLLTDCIKNEAGRYEYFISILEMGQRDRAKLKEWIMAETFARRNQGRQVS